MSTSFEETRDQIISTALGLLGVGAAGEAISPNDIIYCSIVLNAMLKAWMAQGIHLWTEEEGTVYFVTNQNKYNLALSTGANGSDGSGTPVETTLSANGSGSSIQVTTSTGMSIGDNIGVCLSTTLIQWTTISAINGTTVSLTNSLTATANSGNQVFTYASQMPRPLSIQSARIRNAAGFDRLVWIKPRDDYMRIPQKNITGSPTVIYYSPQITTGVVYVWPTPTDCTERLKVTYLRQINDLNSSTDTPDLPQEWLECITYNLAVRVAPAYGYNLTTSGLQGNPDLIRMAAQFLDDLKSWDTEQPYIQIVPNRRY